MTKKQHSSFDIVRAAEDFAESCHIMTIAVSSGNIPWAAPVYYVFYNKGFWFFSSRKSRHIADSSGNSGLAAAAVYAAPHDWKEIRGLQMQGRISHAGIPAGAGAAFAKYISKFGFVENMISGKPAGTLPDIESLFRAGWYVFVPDEIYYSDNSLGFGFRERIL